ncbi:MAG TPA: hypothetical protein VFF11_03475, partial [Candidatus Binatia bacterium]|nr:hypothetical protein [Candidatus Binatia bacterium]
NWVRNGTTTNPDAAALAVPVAKPSLTVTNLPRLLPVALKLDGLLVAGQNRRAIICGESFAPGETKPVQLRGRTVQVRCREIHASDVVLAVDGRPELVTLKMADAPAP